ncbi:sulfite exporter TauE/SafE family protein [Dyella sp. GSA-30]|uniref:sulfite exporter TauE/SafE family protein n=1 Tax=Dyella sp. GSA-30 TaxID=2994496 RepID=UPI00248F8AB4|nr:sulfite exporter TauE/SafE family protein [Dyella sp. GSA-30]BDU21146.1 UPF0721 transmembrane protein [Dyella sp. GSA-30]
MHIGFTLWLLAIAIGASAVGGTLGMAGGIFIVPLLTVFGGMDIRTAVAASIVSVIACSCGSAASFLTNRLTNIRLAITLEVATTSGALTGVLLANRLPASSLCVLFAVVLLISAWQMVSRRRESTQPAEQAQASDWASLLRLHSSYPDQTHGRPVFYCVRRLHLGLALMYGAGVISAMLGIGSGVLKIPAMDSALRLPMKVSSATSNFMIGVTATASGVAYFIHGDMHPAIAGPIALGSVMGAWIGARLLMLIPSDKLRWVFALVLIGLAAQMFMTALGFHFKADAA